MFENEEEEKDRYNSSWSEKWSISEDYGGDDYQDRIEDYYEQQGRLEYTLKTMKNIMNFSEEDRLNLSKIPLPNIKNGDSYDYALFLDAFSKVPIIERDNIINCLLPFYLRYESADNFLSGNSTENLANIIKIFANIPIQERSDISRIAETLLWNSSHENEPFLNIKRVGQIIEALAKQNVQNREGIIECLNPFFLHEISQLKHQYEKRVRGGIVYYSYGGEEDYWDDSLARLVNTIGASSLKEGGKILRESVEYLNALCEEHSLLEESRLPSFHKELAEMLEILIKINPKKRRDVLYVSKKLTPKIDSYSYAQILRESSEIFDTDMGDLDKYVEVFFNKGKKIGLNNFSLLRKVISKVNKKEREDLFNIAQRFVEIHKYERQAKSLAKHIENSRKQNSGLSHLLPKEAKKLLIKISRLDGDNDDMSLFVQSKGNYKNINKSIMGGMFGHLFDLPKDKGNDENLLLFMDILSNIPHKKRMMFFNITKEFLQKNYEKDALHILKTISKTPLEELSNIIFYASSIFEKGGYYKTSPTSIIEGILKIPIQERSRVFHLSKDVIKYAQKTDYHDNRIYIAQFLANLPTLESENIASHAKNLIREEMENIDRISILHALEKCPIDEREELVEMVNLMISSRKNPDFRFMGDEWGSVANAIVKIPYSERRPLVQSVITFMDAVQEESRESFGRSSWVETIEVLSKINSIQREEILNTSFQFFTSEMIHQHKLRIVTGIAKIPPQDRDSLLIFAENISIRAGDITQIIDALLEIKKEEISNIISHVLSFLPQKKEKFGFGDPSPIIKAVSNIPMEERMPILTSVHSITKNESCPKKIAQIIEKIKHVQEEKRASVVNSLNLILSHYDHPSIETINHIIYDIVNIGDENREEYVNKKIEEHIKSTTPTRENFVITHGQPIKKMEKPRLPIIYSKENAIKAFEKSFDNYLDYIFQTSHYSWWPDLEKYSSKITVSDKIALQQFSKHIFTNVSSWEKNNTLIFFLKGLSE